MKKEMRDVLIAVYMQTANLRLDKFKEIVNNRPCTQPQRADMLLKALSNLLVSGKLLNRIFNLAREEYSPKQKIKQLQKLNSELFENAYIKFSNNQALKIFENILDIWDDWDVIKSMLDVLVKSDAGFFMEERNGQRQKTNKAKRAK